MDRYVIDFNLKNGMGHPAISLYLTGCDKPVKCKGCHNYELQKESQDDYSINLIISELELELKQLGEFYDDLYLVILGGEPLAEYNKKIVEVVADYFKNDSNLSVDVVLYSWRGMEQIEAEYKLYLLENIDYGVFGEYKEELHQDNMLPASKNQRLIDFNQNKLLPHIKI